MSLLKSKKILITGGSGYLGKHIAEMLLADQHRITNIIHSSPALELMKYKKYDELHCSEIDQSINSDIIIHCATNYGRDNFSHKKIFTPNLYLPLQLLIERFHIDKPFSFINIDTSLDSATSLYALSKNLFLCSAKETIKQFKLQNIKFINIKLEHFYGPDAPKNNFITYLIESMREKAPRIELTQGEQERDFLYINDAVEAIKKIIDNLDVFDNGITKFEVGSGKNTSIKNAVLMIASFLSYDEENLIFGAKPYRDKEAMFSKVSMDKIINLGWLPKYSFEDGIKEILKK